MMLIQIGLAIFLILHGLVHLLWFVVPWQMTVVDGLPYRTTIFGGNIDVREGGIRFLGLLWVLATIGFVVAGLGLLFSASWWATAVLVAAVYSFLLCLISLPESKWGALIDVGIVAILLFGNLSL